MGWVEGSSFKKGAKKWGVREFGRRPQGARLGPSGRGALKQRRGSASERGFPTICGVCHLRGVTDPGRGGGRNEAPDPRLLKYYRKRTSSSTSTSSSSFLSSLVFFKRGVWGEMQMRLVAGGRVGSRVRLYELLSGYCVLVETLLPPLSAPSIPLRVFGFFGLGAG